MAMLLILRGDVGMAKDGAPLRAFVRPSVAMAPALLRIEAVVEPAAENRSLEVAIDSGTFYRSSTIELEGAAAARAFTVEFRAVPEGSYEVVVALGRAGGARSTQHYRVQVVSNAG